MTNMNLPQKYKGGFINSIINIFRKFIYKKEINDEMISSRSNILQNEEQTNVTAQTNIVTQTNVSNNYIEQMRRESNLLKLKEEILQLVLNNPQVVYNLGEEKLLEVSKLLDDSIEKDEQELQKLERDGEKLDKEYRRLQLKLAQ